MEILCASININRNKIIEYIINNENIDLNYIDESGISMLQYAIMDCNLFILEKFKQEKINMLTDSDSFGYIRDIETFKWFENNIDRKIIEENIESVILNTMPNNNIEFLDYILENYNVKISDLKKENLLEFAKSIRDKLKMRMDRHFEYNTYLDGILPNKKKYNIIKDKAWRRLNEICDQKKEKDKYIEYIKNSIDKEDKNI